NAPARQGAVCGGGGRRQSGVGLLRLATDRRRSVSRQHQACRERHDAIHLHFGPSGLRQGWRDGSLRSTLKRVFWMFGKTGAAMFRLTRVVAGMCVWAGACYGQSASLFETMAPQRGVVPYGNYSLDKLEYINNVTGSVGYQIPIAALPAGRAGFTLDLK